MDKNVQGFCRCLFHLKMGNKHAAEKRFCSWDDFGISEIGTLKKKKKKCNDE